MASAKDVASELEKLIGANDEEATVKQFIDSGYEPLNYALCGRWDGGWPGGRVVEISGPPSAGKTALSSWMMGNVQKMGGLAGFSDHERSFSFIQGANLGLNTDKNKFVYKKPETYEQSISIAIAAATLIREKKLIPASAPIGWVFDSMAAMVPRAVLYDDKGNLRDPSKRNMKDNLGLAAANSAHLPALAQKAEELGMLIFVLNQLRMKPGVVYGDPVYTPGGEAKEFYFSQRIRLKAVKIQKGKGDEAEVLGNEVTAKVIKNKVHRPFLKASWRFMFQNDGSGKFDRERSLIEFLEGEGLLKGGRPGFVDWKGKSIGKEALAREIEKANAIGELRALLPANYEPPAVEAEAEEEAEAA
jgi:recombination protein RecA